MIDWIYFANNHDLKLWSQNMKREDIISINYINEDSILVYYWDTE